MLDTILNAVLPIISKFVPDKEAAQKLAHEIATKQIELQEAQIKVNEEQAKHRSLFVAGARPAIMWMCGIALFYSTMLRDLIIVLSQLIWQVDLSMLPTPDTTLMFNLLLGLLGLGGMRSYDKLKGTATNKISS